MTQTEIVTDAYVFFLNGRGSNWYPSSFRGKLTEDGPTLVFNRGEQYLMAAKAQLFGDQARFQSIMESNDPRTQKQLGREVCDFTKEQWENHAAPIWNAQAPGIMFRGLWYRAVYNPQYAQFLEDTGDRHIVEGNPQDTIWAVGLAWDDPAILDPANWNGTNWLGMSHVEVRSERRRLKAEQLRLQNETVGYNVWSKTFIYGE